MSPLNLNKDFDPEGSFTKDSSLFGMPLQKEAPLHITSCPWEPTTSFKSGCALGPKALLEASKQMDLYHAYFKKIYEKGIYFDQALEAEILKKNKEASDYAQKAQNQIEEGKPASPQDLNKVNQLSDELNQMIHQNSKKQIETGKVPALVGGDHSCPFGLIQALSEEHPADFSIVHIDAHFDFRRAYQGFEHSHASIMYNVKNKIHRPPSIYQLGIRDFCESELNFATEQSHFLLDQEMQKMLLEGSSFSKILDLFFEGLSEKIYISFDIDGLSPEHCPSTGTPVPGGLSYSQASYLIEYLHKKGHRLVGFDLVETSPSNPKALGEGLDEVTAVRILYTLSCFALSQHF